MMEHWFIKLRLEGMTVDEYIFEFSKLSRFAPPLVTEERDRARRFQQGLNLEIQEHMAMTVIKTYAEFLKAAEHQEQATGKRKVELGVSKLSTF